MANEFKVRADLTLNFTDYSDVLSLEENVISEEIYELARRTIKIGGKVIWQKTYVNSDPQTLVVYETMEQLQQWGENLKKIYKMNEAP